MRILPTALSFAAALAVSACGHQPGYQHRTEAKPDVVVSRTYATQPATTYIAPSTTTYVAPDGRVVERHETVPQVIVEPRTRVVEERRYYNDDYVGRGHSQAERQALSRKFYDSCPPGAAKKRAC